MSAFLLFWVYAAFTSSTALVLQTDAVFGGLAVAEYGAFADQGMAPSEGAEKENLGNLMTEHRVAGHSVKLLSRSNDCSHPQRLMRDKREVVLFRNHQYDETLRKSLLPVPPYLLHCVFRL